ncbi:hypothetical protein [Faecalibacter rhinopitheci]|uniref:Uncharacterized protein n=1 Tax=Faecalibacter rhinopitheci TaxID=2779678 RepID=A0A8J7K9U9_9FLAO|nr:hypothetical protein [Faecalibacter rhinopitheci]MBF0596680.1 hypothetical protein [Faecalibacter rhinopitheci]MBQ0147582.1 hypothetical protein [Candidatus Onthonaster equi]
MKKLLTLITLGCLSSCYTQKTVEVIDQSYTNKGCTEEIKVYTNFEAYDEFQRSLVIPGQRNKPLQIIDFSDKNIAVICKENIDQYDISKLELFRNNKLKLHKVKEVYDNSINIFVVELPKEINHLTLEY